MRYLPWNPDAVPTFEDYIEAEVYQVMTYQEAGRWVIHSEFEVEAERPWEAEKAAYSAAEYLVKHGIAAQIRERSTGRKLWERIP